TCYSNKEKNKHITNSERSSAESAEFKWRALTGASPTRSNGSLKIRPMCGSHINLSDTRSTRTFTHLLCMYICTHMYKFAIYAYFNFHIYVCAYIHKFK